MKFARPLVIAASALALLVSACSQPEDVAAPALAPQFGTAFEDRADAVAYDPKRGYSYVAGVDTIDRKGFPFESGGTIFLRRYTQNGILAWQWRETVKRGVDPFVKAVLVDDAGNSYVGWSLCSDDSCSGATVLKFSPAGRVLLRLRIDSSIADLEGDAAGNIYLSGLTSRGETVEKHFVRKYDPQGKLVWERLRTFDDFGGVEAGSIAEPYNLGVAEDGSLYVAGYDDDFVLTRYGRSGRTLWQRTVPKSGVIGGGRFVSVGGGGVYLAVNTYEQLEASRVLLLKYTESGTQVWQRTVLPLGRGAALALDAGRDGNVYLAGRTSPNGTDDDLFARRYTASGGVQWTYAPRLAGTNEIARGVATRGSGNVYLAGSTDGKVNGVNKGGLDAFLIRLNSGGSKVWSR